MTKPFPCLKWRKSQSFNQNLYQELFMLISVAHPVDIPCSDIHGRLSDYNTFAIIPRQYVDVAWRPMENIVVSSHVGFTFFLCNTHCPHDAVQSAFPGTFQDPLLVVSKPTFPTIITSESHFIVRVHHLIANDILFCIFSRVIGIIPCYP